MKKQFAKLYVQRYHKYAEKALLALLSDFYIPFEMSSCEVNYLEQTTVRLDERLFRIFL